MVVLWFEVHVRGSIVGGAVKDRIDQLYDRSIFDLFQRGFIHKSLVNDVALFKPISLEFFNGFLRFV